MRKLRQERTSARQYFPAPRDGARLEINPTGFIWLPVPEADRYEIRIWRKTDGKEVLSKYVSKYYYVPKEPFEPGSYQWTIRAVDKKGKIIGERDPWSFVVPEDAFVAVCPSAAEVIDKLENEHKDKHPILVFPWFEIDEVRERVKTLHKEEFKSLKATVERAYRMGMPEPPTFHLAETEQQKRMYYVYYFRRLRQFININLYACALYYLFTGESKPGEFARRMILHVCSWNPEGPNAVDGPWGDEPGLSYAKCLHECYDWTYDLYDRRERIFVENTLAIYTKQTYRRLKRNEMNFSSHLGRLYPYLGEHVILLHSRLGREKAEEMLQFVLDAFNTWYPHWGGEDGGWAEGVAYGSTYNTFYIPFFTTFEKLTGFSFWNRPFYRKVKDFFVYCCPCNAEHIPFGDGQERGLRPQAWALFRFYGARFKDPVCSWIASKIGCPPILSSVLPFLHPPFKGNIEEVSLPNAKLFRGIGWAALHSDIKNPERDNYLVFKSSPFGSVSHQHADQNSFCILSGGKALAIASGYYGPAYGMPHHALWTRQTKANNCILVDGEGQADRDFKATGRIVDFRDEGRYAYVSGDATPAYKGKLSQFIRHILFIRPDVFIIYDDLKADRPVAFSWLLHSLERPKIDVEKRIINIQRKNAHLQARLFSSSPLDIKYTDQFDIPYNFGMEKQFHEEKPNQHHISATTRKVSATKIAAVIQVWLDKKETELETALSEDYLVITGPDYSVKVRLGPGPADLRGRIGSKNLVWISN